MICERFLLGKYVFVTKHKPIHYPHMTFLEFLVKQRYSKEGYFCNQYPFTATVGMATLTGDDCHHSLNLPIINRLSGPPLRPLAGRYGIGFGPPPLPPLNGKNDSSFMVLPILLSRYIPWSTIDGQCRPRLSLPLSLYERVIYICTPNQVEPLMRWGV